MKTSEHDSTRPALQLVAGAEAELEAELDAMIREICLRPFDDKTWAFADAVTRRQAPRGRLKPVGNGPG